MRTIKRISDNYINTDISQSGFFNDPFPPMPIGYEGTQQDWEDEVVQARKDCLLSEVEDPENWNPIELTSEEFAQAKEDNITLEEVKETKKEEATFLMKSAFRDGIDPFTGANIPWNDDNTDDAYTKKIAKLDDDISGASDFPISITPVTKYDNMQNRKVDLISQRAAHWSAIDALTTKAEVYAYSITYEATT